MNIQVEWTNKNIRLYADGSQVPDYETLPFNGSLVEQWTVTASKQLGPHRFEKSKTCQQRGTPPVVICRELELRVCRELEQEILWSKQLAAEGMAESG